VITDETIQAHHKVLFTAELDAVREGLERLGHENQVSLLPRAHTIYAAPILSVSTEVGVCFKRINGNVPIVRPTDAGLSSAGHKKRKKNKPPTAESALVSNFLLTVSWSILHPSQRDLARPPRECEKVVGGKWQ